MLTKCWQSISPPRARQSFDKVPAKFLQRFSNNLGDGLANYFAPTAEPPSGSPQSLPGEPPGQAAGRTTRRPPARTAGPGPRSPASRSAKATASSAAGRLRRGGSGAPSRPLRGPGPVAGARPRTANRGGGRSARRSLFAQRASRRRRAAARAAGRPAPAGCKMRCARSVSPCLRRPGAPLGGAREATQAVVARRRAGAARVLGGRAGGSVGWPLERLTRWGGWSLAARFAFQGWPARIVESGGALPCWHKLGLWALGSGTRGAGGLLAGQLGARDRLTRHVAVACSRSCACACVRARLWVIGSECLERLAEWAEDLAHATCNMHSARGRGL